MKATFTTLLKNRAFLTPFLISLLWVVALVILGLINIRPSELQVPVRYTSFGIANFYTEQWFYQLTFLVFGLLVFAINTAFSVQLSTRKDESFAVAFQWFTAILLGLVFLTVLAIFRVADLS